MQSISADVCCHCGKPPRIDDALSEIPGVYEDGRPALCCTPCRYEADGLEPHAPVYPAGAVPDVGEGAEKRKLPVCGLCRHGVRQGDRPDLTVRLTQDDLCDEAWEAYWREAAPLWERFRETEQWAKAQFERDTVMQRTELAVMVGMAHDAYGRACDAAELAAPTQEAYAALESVLRQQRDQALNDADRQHRAATQPARAVMEAAVYRAGVELRNGLKAAMSAAEPLFLAHPFGVEPGCYQVCSDCMGKYKPRVRDRLVRGRVLKPSDPLTDAYLL